MRFVVWTGCRVEAEYEHAGPGPDVHVDPAAGLVAVDNEVVWRSGQKAVPEVDTRDTPRSASPIPSMRNPDPENLRHDNAMLREALLAALPSVRYTDALLKEIGLSRLAQVERALGMRPPI